MRRVVLACCCGLVFVLVGCGPNPRKENVDVPPPKTQTNKAPGGGEEVRTTLPD